MNHMIKLRKVLRGIPGCEVKGSLDISISGISANSQAIVPGNLFIAKQGKTYDGRTFIPQAVSAGACAVVTSLFDPSLEHVVQVIHPEVAAIESRLAANGYEYPSQELWMIGITGTNGKTTISFIISYLLEAFFGVSGLIGTIEYRIGRHHYRATRTTPDVVTNHRMLREMVQEGCSTAVMEVTSHALDQKRVDLIDFDVAIFTNLTLDHLDYHETMERYASAKNLLFRELGQGKSQKQRTKWAIVNADDPWTPRMVENCVARVLSYGMRKEADLRASHILFQRHGTFAQVSYRGESVDCYWPLVGRFNVSNCLAAMAVLLVENVPLAAIARRMPFLPPVLGRLQVVPNPLQLKIYVDFAHSDDALIHVLQTLKEMQVVGRLIVVFGCGGDRDRFKRPKMAQACEKYADICIVTSDNPRSEDPNQICLEIIQGFSSSTQYQVIVDRKAAIQKAIELADPDDMILIAGKGHETYQIFSHETIAFDDCQVAADLCHHLSPKVG
jgi:UDP-N-acetylmuramoyl-L-alanyl-D-glutamate--2,6-diaminopimelate ligase